MGAESDLLMKLRPVAFYYKPELDETQTRQYGLVAEEVAKVAPQLVVFDKDGAPQTVRYHFVNAMLLGAVQKQQRAIEETTESDRPATEHDRAAAAGDSGPGRAAGQAGSPAGRAALTWAGVWGRWCERRDSNLRRSAGVSAKRGRPLPKS